MPRICILALAGAGALALPAGASAAVATLDRPCYVSGQPGTLSLSGFAPNAMVTLANADLGTRKVLTDATGSFAIQITPPDGRNFPRPGSREFLISATEDANPANTATAASRIAPLAFATDKGTKSPKATRSWSFSGFVTGQNIYGHFRFKGQTKGNFRFGRAAGPCGEYKRRAPGIPVKGRVSAGSWRVQIDHKPTYSAKTQPSVVGTTVV
ncbi:MAG: hypothetical protein M3417_11760, partial [Actinomycetota bacterium]|nr:hypothetical protein [Actinomycetota bacterium]